MPIAISDHERVVVLNKSFQVIIISIILAPLTFLLMFYLPSLTNETLCDNETKVGVASRTYSIAQANKIKGMFDLSSGFNV